MLNVIFNDSSRIFFNYDSRTMCIKMNGKIVIFMFKDVKRILYYKNIILFGIIIVLFGAHISGHTLFAPAVTTYIAYILGIFNEIEGDSKNEN